jgi:cell wall-associated NlpC family hydrolase
MTEQAARAAIIAEAQAWLRTPWHHNASVRGAGVDCAQLIKACYVGAGVLPDFAVPDYPVDFMLHVDAERLCQTIVDNGGRLTDTPKPGDVVVWQFGKSFSHAGLVVDWPSRVIHAFRPWKCVVETPADAAQLAGRAVRFYTFWG